MDNVILKTALKTLLAVIIAFILALLILCFGFPATTADLCQSFGNYSLAETFSSLNYKYYGNIEDLYNCANYSILAKNDNKIIENCKAFSEDGGFEAYCAEHDGLKHRIFSNLASAQYRKGDKEGALATVKKSFEGVTDFPAGNAAVSLTVEIGKAKDRQSAAALKEFLDGKNLTPSDGQQLIYDNVIKVLQDLINNQV
ncbi:MAG: hypothetical protein K2N68_01060 [Clostridia bacterium]|nr:hypothetical protein [Clostridia bacterium]